MVEFDSNIDIHTENEYAFRWSCSNGYIDVAKWLLKLDSNINIHICNDYAFRYSCGNGHLHVAKWLLNLDKNIDISAYYNEAFLNSCSRGHLDVVKWLINRVVNINENTKTAFQKSCNSHIDVAKLSIKSFPNIDSHSYNHAFQCSCAEGHIQIAKWLIEFNPDINIRDFYHYVFRSSCSRGHYNVAKWLTTICSKYEIKQKYGKPRCYYNGKPIN